MWNIMGQFQFWIFAPKIRIWKMSSNFSQKSQLFFQRVSWQLLWIKIKQIAEVYWTIKNVNGWPCWDKKSCEIVANFEFAREVQKYFEVLNSDFISKNCASLQDAWAKSKRQVLEKGFIFKCLQRIAKLTPGLH